MSAPRLPWDERACDGQTAWGDLRVCRRRFACLRFEGQPRREYLEPRDVDERCADFLPINTDDDARR